MRDYTDAQRPETLSLAYKNLQLHFVRVTGDQYAIEVNGIRSPLRLTRMTTWDTGGVQTYSPVMRQGRTVNIDAIIYARELDAECQLEKTSGLKLSIADKVGHYRRWTYVTILIKIEASGLVDIQENVIVEDRSCY